MGFGCHTSLRVSWPHFFEGSHREVVTGAFLGFKVGFGCHLSEGGEVRVGGHECESVGRASGSQRREIDNRLRALRTRLVHRVISHPVYNDIYHQVYKSYITKYTTYTKEKTKKNKESTCAKEVKSESEDTSANPSIVGFLCGA